ncbi:hypothetical protein F7984_07675 [Pradoshia sp. D12]|uniref:hypothetical protein n=1 Tax=Bacillaceae TaxID=186817 RepID=UPI0011123929|nr:MULTISPECIES: hypothetical protein [Bacillaceae]QFK71133.1 hypothetical protein F7984_07675 [Pradoshia sp. D12]TPF72926.1 hypothetical protein FHY44_04065 [Bacillus sp. D12]
MNRDKYDGLHFLAIICITFLQLNFGFNDWIFGLLITIYAVFAILVIEGLSKYSVTKFIILLPMIFLLRIFITLYS